MSIVSCLRPWNFLIITILHLSQTSFISPWAFLYPVTKAPQFGQYHEKGSQSAYSFICVISRYIFLAFSLCLNKPPAVFFIEQICFSSGYNNRVPNTRSADLCRRRTTALFYFVNFIRFPVLEYNRARSACSVSPMNCGYVNIHFMSYHIKHLDIVVAFFLATIPVGIIT